MQKLNYYDQIKFPVAADASSNDEKSDKYKDFNRNTQRWLVALTVLVLATLVVGGTALVLVINEIHNLKMHIEHMETTPGMTSSNEG